jgi:hypothetical protein
MNCFANVLFAAMTNDIAVFEALREGRRQEGSVAEALGILTEWSPDKPIYPFKTFQRLAAVEIEGLRVFPEGFTYFQHAQNGATFLRRIFHAIDCEKESEKLRQVIGTQIVGFATQSNGNILVEAEATKVRSLLGVMILRSIPSDSEIVHDLLKNIASFQGGGNLDFRIIKWPRVLMLTLSSGGTCEAAVMRELSTPAGIYKLEGFFRFLRRSYGGCCWTLGLGNLFARREIPLR